MATATKDKSDKHAGKPGPGDNGAAFDPDNYRMTIGEHLEELRTRLVLSLLGFAVALVVCFIFGEKVVWYFCRPLAFAQEANHLPPQVFATEVSEPFMVFIKISMICAAAIASPWMLFQLWQFVAAGLYPHERKYITRYMPLSITLLISGMVFLYYVVLPWMLEFFIAFSIGPAITMLPPAQRDPSAASRPVMLVPMFNGDPAKPVEGQIWMDLVQHRLKFFFEGHVRVMSFGSDTLVTPIISLAQYIDMVVNMLLSFGVAFQMPLVVLLLVRIGIVDVPTLKKARKYVYFGIAIVAGFIVPDVVGGMIALMIPLMFLFELGLWMARDPLAPRARGTGAFRENARLWWRRLTAGGSGQKLLTFIGTVVLIGLLIHAMMRSRSAQNTPSVAPPPAATQPAAVPTSQPSTRPMTVPTGPAPAAR